MRLTHSHPLSPVQEEKLKPAAPDFVILEVRAIPKVARNPVETTRRTHSEIMNDPGKRVITHEYHAMQSFESGPKMARRSFSSNKKGSRPAP